MSKTREDWDKFFLAFAEQCAQQSYDHKTKVGCVIARDDDILSYSYNGTPPGWSNGLRDSGGKTYPYVIHAEAFALAKLARSGVAARGATLYCTLSPCVECVKLIITTGISRVVYRDSYKCQDGIGLLKRAEIETTQYPEPGVVVHHCLGTNREKYADEHWLKEHTCLQRFP